MSSGNGTNPIAAPNFADAFKAMVKEAVAQALTGLKPGGSGELLDPEELAAKLKVPPTWVYEQSRQGKIPTHRIGKYIRFDLEEVLTSLRNKNQE
jgi:excisionase family DNA binding protein